jgi:phosphoribosylformylglycinamidine synthase
VTNSGNLRMSAVGGEITVATEEAEKLWEEAIPCLMK